MGYLKTTSNLNADRIKFGKIHPDRLPESIKHPKITVGPTEPENPSIGDIWIQTNE